MESKRPKFVTEKNEVISIRLPRKDSALSKGQPNLPLNQPTEGQLEPACMVQEGGEGQSLHWVLAVNVISCPWCRSIPCPVHPSAEARRAYMWVEAYTFLEIIYPPSVKYKIPVKAFRQTFLVDLIRKGARRIPSLSKDQNVGQTARNHQRLQSRERNQTFFFSLKIRYYSL